MLPLMGVIMPPEKKETIEGITISGMAESAIFPQSGGHRRGNGCGSHCIDLKSEHSLKAFFSRRD
jgi:hypothetical protein